VPHYGRGPTGTDAGRQLQPHQIRSIGERSNATLKTWRLLRRPRCCPQHATALTAAILVLQQVEDQHEWGWKGSMPAVIRRGPYTAHRHR
jgi:hypothetical protein